MNRFRYPEWAACLLLLLLLSLACNLETRLQPQATTTPPLEPTPTLILPAPTQTAVNPDSGWQLLRPGLERRVLNVVTADSPSRESLYILRVDPANFRFDIGYHPGQPQSLEQWQTETGALIVVNGGFFTEGYIATGAIVVDGQSSGTSYQDFGGMLAITADGPSLRWLPQQPYDPVEGLLAGLQSFPMLVTPGGLLGYPDEDFQRARRTVIAQNVDGRMLFILAVSGTFSLHQMSRFLTESDLDIDRALNLDGGSSTGLLLSDPSEGVSAFDLLPTVVLVYPK
ncbi:MAG: phosphodiester glycosidase family protein [Candidatus Promineifilaceae bacterium]